MPVPAPSMPGYEGLNWRQRKFVLLFIASNGELGSSAAGAGYRGDPWNRAKDLLANPGVQRAIATEEQRIRERFNLDLDRTMGELHALGFSTMADFVTVGEDGRVRLDLRAVTPAAWSAVKTLTIEDTIDRNGMARQKTRFELHEKHPALLALARHHGLGLGKAKALQDDRRQRGDLAARMARLSEDELDQLQAIAQRLEDDDERVAGTLDAPEPGTGTVEGETFETVEGEPAET